MFRFELSVICFIILLPQLILAQSKTMVTGQVVNQMNQPIPFANIYLKSTSVGTSTGLEGEFTLKMNEGSYTLIISAQGYRSYSKKIQVSVEKPLNIAVTLVQDVLGLDEVVISATRNRVKRRDAPVVVSTLSQASFQNSQSISLAEGLNYSPGVRTETNCQNCGFTQVRLNGLDGSYTQILLNSRPVFSSLLGVYGLEQIPSSIIEQVEVVRSGGSALFGSNAIAGTINVITKDPVLNTWEIGSNLSYIDGQSFDRILNFNSSSVSDDLNSGVTFFGNTRYRSAYDANSDGFTELVELTNHTLGANSFFKPTNLSRVGLNLTAIKEYRRGGDQLDLAPQFTDITEQLDHNTFIGGLDYEQTSSDKTRSFTAFSSVSHTDRKSYYGGLGGGRTAQDSLTASRAFGNTKDLALVSGVKYSNKLKNEAVLTTGIDLNYSSTQDEISGYNRLINQNVTTLAGYGQYEWKPFSQFTALFGTRLDYVQVDGLYTLSEISRAVNLKQIAVSPRLNLSYSFTEAIRLRAGYARGFRAPQAFNEDLHISSVGGEQQFVILSETLNTEYSNAFTASLNISEVKKIQQYDLLIEGFFTQINDPFTLVSTGNTLSNGSIVEEVRNGNGAIVYGTNFELKYSPSSKYRFQIGATLQTSAYKTPQILYEAQPNTTEKDVSVNKFVRNPNTYGFLAFTYQPNENFNLNLTGNYTGKMIVPQVVNANGFQELTRSPHFVDVNLKLETHFHLNDEFMITFSGGIKNIFQSYQSDFNRGPTRDSDYVYGPALPRSVFVGLKFGKLH